MQSERKINASQAVSEAERNSVNGCGNGAGKVERLPVPTAMLIRSSHGVSNVSHRIKDTLRAHILPHSKNHQRMPA
jgi:hypothetical protein